MISKKLKKELHKIALDNKVSDTVAEMVVLAPFLFQKRTIEEVKEQTKTTFYHKYLGKFYIRTEVLKKLKEKIKHGE